MEERNELQVTGMSCNHCVAAVKRALEGVQGVGEVEVDLTTGKATVTGNADAGALIAAVEAQGYRAAPVR